MSQGPTESPSTLEAGGAGSHDGETGRAGRALRRKLLESTVTVFVFLMIFTVFAVWLGGRFANVDARLLDVHQNVPILLLGLAVLITLIGGLFDLSVAGVATFSTFLVIGLTVKGGWPFWLVILVVILVGMLAGLINGFLVERLKVNTFIATLGTGAVFLGLSAVYSGGTLIAPSSAGPQLPEWFSTFGAFREKAPAWIIGLGVVLSLITMFMSMGRLRPASLSRSAWIGARLAIVIVFTLILIFVLQLPAWISGISWALFLLLVVALVMWVLIQFTTYGRSLQATGSNRTAARLAGVRVQREVVKAFLIGGVLAAISGIALAANQGSAAPDIATSFLLPAFAAAFLSTVVFSNGRFTVPGTIVGGIFVIWVGQALVIGGLPPTWVNVVNGVVLIGAVALSTVMRSRR